MHAPKVAWLSNRTSFVKVAWAFGIAAVLQNTQRDVIDWLDRASAALFSSELSSAGSRVVSAVDIGSPHNGSSQVGSSYVLPAVSMSCSQAKRNDPTHVRSRDAQCLKSV